MSNLQRQAAAVIRRKITIWDGCEDRVAPKKLTNISSLGHGISPLEIYI